MVRPQGASFLCFFVFGRAGSSFLLRLLSSCGTGVVLSRRTRRAAQRGGSSRCGRAGSGSSGLRAPWLQLAGSRAQTQWLRHTGLAALRHMGSSQIEHWSCVGRQILYTEPPGKPTRSTSCSNIWSLNPSRHRVPKTLVDSWVIRTPGAQLF